MGTLFPRTPVVLAEGSPVTIGVGQRGRWAVTFVYTRCPMPEYCPLVVSRFQALQPMLPEGARLLAITIDPEHDSKSVLRTFAAEAGAEPGRWDFGRVPGEVLFGLAEKAGLPVHGEGMGISHDLVLLILDGDGGRLVARYPRHGLGFWPRWWPMLQAGTVVRVWAPGGVHPDGVLASDLADLQVTVSDLVPHHRRRCRWTTDAPATRSWIDARDQRDGTAWPAPSAIG